MQGRISAWRFNTLIGALLLSVAFALLALRSAPPVAEEPKISTHPQRENTYLESEPSEPIESVFIKGDVLSYAGYVVERSFDSSSDQSFATIKRNGKVLVTFDSGFLTKESTKFGLFPFVGGDPKEIVIFQYTGGMHCCWIYWIYELAPTLQLLFDGDEYDLDIGHPLHTIDIDRDGQHEFTQSVMAFDYFYVSHAASVFPTAVFAYDQGTKKYVLANRRFRDFLLHGVEEDIKKALEVLRRSDPVDIWNREKYMRAILQVVTKYIYAGEEKAGWEFFDREYKLPDKEEFRSSLRMVLNRDSVYQSLR